MNAEIPIVMEARPRWRRGLSVALKRGRFVPLVEGLTLISLLVMATISYFIITDRGSPETLQTPPMVATLLVANLVPAMALMVLVAVATVGGVFFAVLQDPRSLLCFGFAIAYVATRSVLHVKRKLSWPFI